MDTSSIAFVLPDQIHFGSYNNYNKTSDELHNYMFGMNFNKDTIWVDIFEELKFREYQYQARL